LFCSLAFGQEPATANPRPTIGLVLEGGGALGLAHIGVLRWLEEHRIPVDYIAGTSMGGLVGGAYAIGMRAQEVRTLVTGIDWDAVLRGGVEFPDLSFRRKEDRRAYPNGLEFGLRHGVSFPAGFNSGEQVGFVLDRIALPYSGLKTFDDLPIPFRCLSTELTSRSLHVFKDGPLSLALRSTMSIPGFFTPVKSEGKIYVDGALLDNLPTDVARGMGADIVIAVHLETAELSPDASLSSVSTLLQAFSTVTANTERRGMELADIVVRVDLSKFSSTDYKAQDKIIDKGYAAAENSAPALLKLGLDESRWSEHIKHREARRIRSVPAPTFVAVTGAPPAVADEVKLELKGTEGRPIDEAGLERELLILTGTGRFASLGYGISQVDDRFGLHIDAVEKGYAPPTVNPLVAIGSELNNIRFAVGARFTFADVGKAGAELRTDVLGGSTDELSAQYFRPLARSIHWFVQPQADVGTTLVDIYSRGTELAVYRKSQTYGGLDVGYMFDRFSQVLFGYQIGWLGYSPEIGIRELPTVSGRQGITSAQYVLDRLDNAIVPRKGVAIGTGFSFYDSRPGAQQTFPSFQSTIRFFKPIRSPDSVYFLASGGSTFGYTATGVPLFNLGAPMHLSAYGLNEIYTNQYMLFQLGYLHQLAKLSPVFGDKMYLNSVVEVAKPYGTPNISRIPMDGSAGIVIETLFGPVYVGGSWGDSGHRKIFFLLGRIF
jgi:NTE family protein